MEPGNNTTVVAGALAGSSMSIVWWLLEVYNALPAVVPDPVVAASVVVVTALFQWVKGVGK